MSALARWFQRKGKMIAGYDRTRTKLCEELENEGIIISYEDNVNAIPLEFKTNITSNLIIYTPAIPTDQKIISYFRMHRFMVKKRAEVLGEITKDHFTIAVAGTHGKTTTSSLIAHILNDADTNMVAFLGGIATNYQSNLIINDNKDGDPLRVIVEADEYDRSFLTLKPDIAVITALDPDHLDIYGNEAEMKTSYSKFVNNIKPEGFLIIKKKLSNDIDFESGKNLKIKEYSLYNNPVRAEGIRLEKEEMRFNYVSPNLIIENIPFAFPGYHNIENAIAAITVGLILGINSDIIKLALSTFRGIKRRFEYILYADQVIYIDDYAHHPEEIKAFLHSVRSIFPDHRITAVFQPHLFTRTRDFSKDFAESLELADEIILLDIYPARENPIPGVTSELIFKELNTPYKQMLTMENLIDHLKDKNIDVIVTIGAGDIDQMVIPIKKLLVDKYEISA